PLAVEALAVRLDGRLTVLLANLQDDSVEVSLSLPTFVPIHLRMLDETTFELAATEPERFRQQQRTVSDTGGVVNISLLPYAVATLAMDEPVEADT
ncbi:MAG TPA: hypothetical protein VER37_07065, partial [Thermomicrobiales bacterium]|nr:hypothetical protein [Thermomicrobiales bacterium]